MHARILQQRRKEVTDDEGALRPRSYTGETYGLGYYQFEKLLADWRLKNDLSGLVVKK